MKRQFQARTLWQTWFLLVLMFAFTVYAGWRRDPIMLMIGLLVMVVLIERMIHGCYTVTSQTLLVHNSRYQRDVEIPLRQIERIDEVRSMRFFDHSLHHFLQVVYRDEQGREHLLSITPKNPGELVDCVKKNRNKLSQSPS